MSGPSSTARSSSPTEPLGSPPVRRDRRHHPADGHARPAGAPNLAVMTSGQADDQPGGGGGGWPWVLSDLKSLLETGTAFSRPS